MSIMQHVFTYYMIDLNVIDITFFVCDMITVKLCTEPLELWHLSSQLLLRCTPWKIHPQWLQKKKKQSAVQSF